MFYSAAENAHGLPHDPFKAIVSPRPIGWISTRSLDGRVNLAPYSFFNAISDNPKLVMFSSTGKKDSATFAIESGEFVANLATGPLAEKVNLTSTPAPQGQSEFEIAGLSEAESVLVSSPRVAEAPAALECKVTQWFRPRNLEGEETGNWIVIGQVIGIHIAETVLQDGLIRMDLARPLSRLGYLDYATVTDVFQMRRPPKPA